MKKNIDLDSLTEQELRELNRQIIQRLQIHSLVRQKSQLNSFRIGDRVAFETDSGTVGGMVTRINQKTATIVADDGRGWRVSPGFLNKIVGEARPAVQQENLFSISTNPK